MPEEVCLFPVGTRVSVVGGEVGVVTKFTLVAKTGMATYLVKLVGGGKPKKFAEANLSLAEEEGQSVEPPQKTQIEQDPISEGASGGGGARRGGCCN